MFSNIVKFGFSKYGAKRQMLDIFPRQMSSTLNGSNQQMSDRQYFDSLFPIVAKDLTDSMKHLNIPSIIDWYTRLLEYNVPIGKKKRGFSTVLSYQLLQDPQKLTAENLRLAGIMGWCSELLTTSLLISDDILDQSEIRRGVPCWYKLANVGMSAINDAIVLEQSAFVILRKYFRDHPCYMSMVDLFHDSIMHISTGLTLEHLTSSTGSMERFSIDTYRTIALYKTACFAFKFPVVLAMYLAGIRDAEIHRNAESVLLELGCWVQVKNDFLDCFGDETEMRKERYGDIREGKCTWTAVVALERATDTQRAVLERCYGHSDEQSVQAVMDIYRALDMSTLYSIYEEQIRETIRTQIEQLDPRLPKQIFYNIMEVI